MLRRLGSVRYQTALPAGIPWGTGGNAEVFLRSATSFSD